MDIFSHSGGHIMPQGMRISLVEKSDPITCWFCTPLCHLSLSGTGKRGFPWYTDGSLPNAARGVSVPVSVHVWGSVSPPAPSPTSGICSGDGEELQDSPGPLWPLSICSGDGEELRDSPGSLWSPAPGMKDARAANVFMCSL